MEITPCFLVIADISGYTRFMKFHASSVLHAEAIITSLLEAVLDKADYPLTIAKLEGDAVFLYAAIPLGQEAAAARDITNQITKMFTAFYAKERAFLHCEHGCVCEACEKIGELKLKAILHLGEVTFKQIRQFTELGGPEVMLIHRLLKNTIPSHEYILMTQPFHALAGDYADQVPEPRTEPVEDFGALDVLVYYPRIEISEADLPLVKGTDLAGWVNQHSFGRMFGLRKRQNFRNLPLPRMNLPLYLFEGISSGLNVLSQQIRRITAAR